MRTVKIHCKARAEGLHDDLQECRATISPGVFFDFEITDDEGWVEGRHEHYPEEVVFSGFAFDVELEIPVSINVVGA